MMARHIAAVALAFLSTPASSFAGQEVPGGYEQRHFAGTIGKHKVFAAIEIDGGTIEGRYSYGAIPYGNEGWLALQGTVAADGAVEIDEVDQGAVGDRQIPYVSGHFRGQMDPARSRITGTWTNSHPPKGHEAKPLPFELSAIGRTFSFGDSRAPVR